MFVKAHHNPKFIRSLSKSRKYLLVRERLRAIEMAMQGMSIHYISNHLDRSISSIKRWVKEYNEKSINQLLEKNKKTRRIKLPESLKDKFIERVCNGPKKKDKVSCFNLKNLQNILNKEFHVKYSQSGTYNLLKKLGLSYAKPRPTHSKTDKTKQKQWVEKELPFF